MGVAGFSPNRTTARGSDSYPFNQPPEMSENTRLAQIKPEKDVELCPNTDVLLIESKWKNGELVESALDRMASTIEIEVLNDLDVLTSRMRNIPTK